MRQASQQELCLKLQQTVRHLQGLVMKHEVGTTALSAQLREQGENLTESEVGRKAAEERAVRAEARADALENTLRQLQNELDRHHDGADLTAELQARFATPPNAKFPTWILHGLHCTKPEDAS